MVHSCDQENDQENDRKRNKSTIHTEIVRQQLETADVHPLLGRTAPNVSRSEQQLQRSARRTLAQLRAQKCPLLQGYLFSIGAAEAPGCPLCGLGDHDTRHIFQCEQIHTTLTPEDLWRRPVEVSELVDRWRERLAELEEMEEV